MEASKKEEGNIFTIQKSFAIRAGAGSGKTYTLSRRYINAYLGFDLFRSDENLEMFFEEKDKKKAEIDEIVTITFTNAAANEMKERIFNLMKTARRATEENLDGFEFIYGLDDEVKKYVKERIEKGLTKISDSIITTIHGFSLILLKRYGDYLGINVEDVVDDIEREKIFREVFEESLKEELGLVEKILEDISLYKVRIFSGKYIFDAKFKERFDKFVDKFDYNFLFKIYKDIHRYKVRSKLLEKNKNYKDYFDVVDMYIDDLADNKNNESLTFYQFLKKNKDKKENISLAEKIDFLCKNENKEKRNEMSKILNALRDKSSPKVYPTDDKKEPIFKEHLENFRRLLSIVYEKYQKKLGNKLDFNKMLQKALELLDKKDITFKYVMVDEFQDSNTIQYEIAKKISKGNNLFIVGDEKQAIYAFQGGEIEVFKKAQKDLKIVKSLDVNYRSDKGILDFVNSVFEEIFGIPEEELPIENDFCATFEPLKSINNNKGTIAVLYSEKDTQNTVREKESKNIALLVKGIIEGKIYPHIKENYINKGKKAIGVIYDSKTYMYLLKKELEKLGVAVKIHGVEEFWDLEEIKDMFAFLELKYNSTLTLPERKFYTTSILLSKAYNCSDKCIKDFIDNNKSIQLINEEVMHKFIRKIFIKTDLYKRYDEPNAAKANIEELIREVVILEDKYDYNYQKIIETLEEKFFNEKKSIAEYDSPVAGLVELSSIHYTKGLEYPVIILAQSEKKLNPSRMEGIVDAKYTPKDKNEDIYVVGFKIGDYKPVAYRVADEIDRLRHIEEKKRLLYVALTRAKHNIIISVGKGNFNANSYSAWLNVGVLKEISLSNITEERLNFENEEIKIDRFYGEFDIFFVVPDFTSEINLGKAVHKIIELYSETLEEEQIKKMCDVYCVDFEKAKAAIENFKNSDVFKQLQEAETKEFEWEFEDEEGIGRIDLWYIHNGVCKIVDFKTGNYGNYEKQLERYKRALKKIYNNVEVKLLRIGEPQ